MLQGKKMVKRGEDTKDMDDLIATICTTLEKAKSSATNPNRNPTTSTSSNFPVQPAMLLKEKSATSITTRKKHSVPFGSPNKVLAGADVQPQNRKVQWRVAELEKVQSTTSHSSQNPATNSATGNFPNQPIIVPLTIEIKP